MSKYDSQGNIEYTDILIDNNNCLYDDMVYDYMNLLYGDGDYDIVYYRWQVPQSTIIIRMYEFNNPIYQFKYGRKWINGNSYCAITDLKTYNIETQQYEPIEVNKDSIHLTSEILQEYVNSKPLNLVSEYSYDINSDSVIDTEDVALHLQYLRDN